ncbi:hypothetical protein C7120_09430 [Prevotella sp. oral taxon 376]|uniref:hypothetical protein n=1 Tax=Prevotella sp. oral taxon 376 TaxID=712466 RepID=UPI000D1F373B|nr:hypothetical protein [Prevotella sp. oral taxon 376]PTL32536.1 hypothetical protein C7120_09430 [Prevotella sp. oral taxon 376]
MKKRIYNQPAVELFLLSSAELMQLPGASQFDNDGDGQTDQRPPIIGDPDEGIGAKRGIFDYDET